MVVRVIKAYMDECVEIQWQLRDGAIYIERHTVAPKEVREVRMELQESKGGPGLHEGPTRKVEGRRGMSLLRDTGPEIQALPPVPTATGELSTKKIEGKK